LGPLPNGVATCGACTAQLADGVDCTDNNECVNGLCAEDVCASYGGVGDACTSSEGCLGSGYCDPGTDQCAAEPTWAVGTPCSTFPFDCGGPGADLFCHPTTQLCVAYLDLADPCDPDAGAAAYCRIFTYESCQDVGGGTFQCVEPTTRSAGQSCGFFTGEKCGTGLICDEGSETCVATAGIDEDCTSNPCEGLLECVGGVCQYGSHTGMCPSS
jgi:hypothetical protein